MTILWIILGIAAFIIILLAIIGLVSFKKAIYKPLNAWPIDPDDTLRLNRAKIREKNNNYLYSLKPEDLTLRTPDGLNLKAWFLQPEKPSKRFVICIHGYQCNGPDECSHLLRFYRNELGYNYLLPDLRAHGRSEGKYAGFGQLDYADIQLWTDYLVDRFGEDIEIILHGISMGAGTAMLTVCNEPREQVKLCIEDCGYTNAYDVILNTANDMFPAFFRKIKFTNLVTSLGSIFCKIFAKYSYKEADPLGKMKDCKTPIMFVHGTADDFVPFEMVHELYDACPTKKKLFTVKDAEHAFSYYNAMPEYQQAIKDFLKETIDT